MIPFVALIAVVLVFAMIRKIPDGERAVVFRFGKPLHRVKGFFMEEAVGFGERVTEVRGV